MRRHFALSFSSVLSIAIALLISMLMLVLAWNVSSFTTNIEEELIVQVSLNPTLDASGQKQLKKEIQKIQGISLVRFSDKEAELEQLIEDYGDTFAQYEGEDRNPLYDVFIVELEDPTQIEDITSKISKLDGVVEATYGTDTVNTMVQLFSSVRVGGLVFVAALIGLAIFLIRNTIKLAIQVRKDEIQIMRQVGAMNWYITVPFVLEGLLTGFLGALIPSLICIFGYTALYQALNGVFISELFVLKDPYPFLLYVCGVLFLIGILAGMLGSYLASRKYLRWTR